ncbi:FtsX-like permease family protein [Mesorhizobium sp. M4B.F.Ca.ET.215.01.1.1]|uniref:ABC transporter permease n=1 Tax=unclassified Mesorhizobium TaxID=325217 RepID=UPI000FCB8F84|nr:MULTISPECIES: FtsX-like permease family protein [unclassified Mesorhizobium]RUW27755.1 FtsX-like permease family protein [Mesorhizobium sp. M4B.F.Ca.ET.013.02.1.1]RVD39315.1 FtsX-like permease family protein [Mesorhizobium sp. M4B.F.Ca.ET.019.03.1.1]RWF67766.1 MAG: FtsX-like permease family protein [Mesorhizobium sp.]TGQ18459.1 FtsX-like permease family protein [Mesorhizobium sp. M4B.F.Ca.ET.215.01.1.1]TGQ37058.1 FtsX-like permease family protein [Mesorhizobium sp. M4B.F.Ca.ET.214.01.1.1]
MSVLDRKLLRDLLRMWAQVLAIALVMACGVATIVIAVGGYRSLEQTRNAFYNRYRFATVFSGLTRAPLHLRERIASIAGISGIELRIVKPVLLDMPGMAEPATAIAVSIPDRGEPAVNRLYLRNGRLPESGRPGEVAVTERFATARRMAPGSTFDAILNGRKRTLSVTGIVLTPEYIYALGPGDMVPDPRRFGVFFMPRTVLAGIFDMDGAFNDVAVRTQRSAGIQAVEDAVDRILKPYGGIGTHGRTDQISHAFLDNELIQLRAMATVIPPVFLFVSAFLVNMILSRLIVLEREQIGLMKAVGYGSGAIGWHYGKLTLVIASIGIAIGAGAGNWLGHGLTTLYARFFSFPFLIFQQSLDLYAVAATTSALAALLGAARAIWSVITLPPAVAMQPPAPALYQSFLTGEGRLLSAFSQLTIMAFRHLLRWPLRSLLTALGTSLAVALLVTALFSFDSIAFMVDTVFFRAERQDATLSFGVEQSTRALQSVAAMPGVLRAEPFRATAVILRHGHRERRLVISSVPPKADLARVLDLDLAPIDPPPAGLTLSERVASLLDLRIGDLAEVELLERAHQMVRVPVTSIVQSYVGLAVYMRTEALDRLVGGGPRISGVRVAIDPARLGDLYSAVKQTPAIASIALQGISRQRFRETIGENITIMTTVYTALAVIIAFGVVYNSARIQLSERARELAGLRVLGFTRSEVSSVLLIELAAIVALAQPLGWMLGYLFSWSVVRGFESDLFRIPFVVNRSTFALASLVVLAVATLSALIVRRRIDRLDLVRVLKTRD